MTDEQRTRKLLQLIRAGRVRYVNDACLNVDASYSARLWPLFANSLHQDGLINYHWPTGALTLTQRGIDYLDQAEAAETV
jgi:hypothetical protein